MDPFPHSVIPGFTKREELFGNFMDKDSETGVPNPLCGYVGEVVDDMEAAQGAKRNLSMVAVGFTRGHANRDTMKDPLIKAGAALVIENPKQLLSLVF